MKDIGNPLLRRPKKEEPSKPKPQPSEPPAEDPVEVLSPVNIGETIEDEEFGVLIVNTVKKQTAPSWYPISTTVYKDLYDAAQAGGGGSDFLRDSMKFLSNINDVVDASQRLGRLRRLNAGVQTLTSRVSLETGAKLERAVEFVSKVRKISLAALVGGCALLLAEERGLLERADV